MNKEVKPFLLRWLISVLAVLVAARLVRGITYGTSFDLVLATLILSFLNAFLRPILLLISLPLLLLTLGLFTLVINAGLLLLVSKLMGPEHFHVKGFGAAFLGALVISIVSLIANSLTGSGDSKVRMQRVPPAPKDPDNRPGGNGPVIDV